MRKLPLPLVFTILVSGSVLAQTQSESTDSLIVCCFETVHSGRKITIRKAVDYPATILMAGWTLYNFSATSKHEGVSDATLATLHASAVNGFDRWAIKKYVPWADKASYIPFYTAIVYPVAFFLLDKKMRPDFFKLMALYVETMTVTGSLYGPAIHYVNRYRPLVYDVNSESDRRHSSNARKAFFAGHVALVGTATFFVARLFDDYHPGSQWKWAVYAAAGAATATTAFLRGYAGEHFPSDLLIGTAVGVASGMLVPILHESKIFHNDKLTISPYGGMGEGLLAIYRF